MPNWNEIESEIQALSNPHDVIRRKYLAKLHDLTGRNVIIYYSGWLQKGSLELVGYTGFGIQDNDKNGFMATIHQLDRDKGLDLILHTPGGEVSATESLVDYLRSMFGKDIRAIVPQLAMSGGTMIALSCKSILMGKHSSLGPIDPQLGGIAAHGIIEEFEKIKDDITHHPHLIQVWHPIISKYGPTLIGECQKAIDWSNQIVEDWMRSSMFEGDPDADAKVPRIMTELADHALTKSHSRHISLEKAQDLGIGVVSLEDDQDLQDAVLTVHHACIQTLSSTPACKIIENHNGVAYVDTFDPKAA